MPLPLVLLAALFAAAAQAATFQTRDGLALRGELPVAIAGLALDGNPLGTGAGGFTLTDPRTGQPPAAGAFTLTATAKAGAERILLTGELRAAGEQETVCLLSLRLPVGADGWLFWDGLDKARPIASGGSYIQAVHPLACVTSADRRSGVAVALDPDPLQPAHFVYDPREHMLVVNWQLGFTPLARPELHMRAPFAVELYRTAPGWAFRSALERYYRFHPAKFDQRAKYEGLWEFATPTESLPNPQHYAYNEGGPPCTADLPRGIHTFPYTCTGDLIIALPPEWGTPKTYEEMLDRLDRWAKIPKLPDWDKLSPYTVSTDRPHSGEQSLQFTSAKAGDLQEVRQTIRLAQKKVNPVTVSVWTRAENVTGEADHDYGLWLDVVMADGTNQFGRAVPAAVGTHDWQPLAMTVGQDQPIAEIRLYLLFRGNHSGNAWFDDLLVATASQPGRNLAKTAGFESSGPPPELQYLRDNAMYDATDHLRYHPDTWGGADVGPASPINWLRFTPFVNPEQTNPEGRQTEAGKDLAIIEAIFKANPDCAGIYMDGTSAGTTVTTEYRRDFFRFFRDPFTYEAGAFRPCGNGMAAVVRYVDEFKRRFPGKLAFGNVWASNRMFPVCMALDVPGYESSRWYDLDYADYYRASAARKPGLYLNYFRLNQQLDTREGGERFFRYATAYGLFPSIGRVTDEAYEKFGDLQHLYVPIVNHLFRAGWEPVTHATTPDPEVRLQRFGTRMPIYLTALNPTANPRQVKLTIDAAALGMAGIPAALEMSTSASLPVRREGGTLSLDLPLGPQDVAAVVLLAEDAVAGWYRERAAESLEGAALVYASTPPTAACASLARPLREAAKQRHKADVAWTVRQRQLMLDVGTLRTAAEELPDDLKRTSYRRESEEVDRLLRESLLADVGGRVGWQGRTIVPEDEELNVAAETRGPASAKLTVDATSWAYGRLIETRRAGLAAEAGGQTHARRRGPADQGITFECTVFCEDASGEPLVLTRRGYGWFSPVSELAATFEPAGQRIAVRLRNLDSKPRVFALAAEPAAGLTLEPAEQTVPLQGGAGATPALRAVFAPGAASGRYPVRLTLRLQGGAVLEQTTIDVLHILPLEPGDLALDGAQVAVDSAYYAYDEKPLNDGVVQPEGVPFNQAAWAAAETVADHWAQLTWPAPRELARMVVYWNLEDEQTWTSRRLLVQAKVGDAWQTVAEVSPSAGEPVTTLRFAPVKTAAVRLLQPKGDGPPTRPNILWLREVAVYGP